ncbi:Serine/threonine-protein kinase PEPKR2 (Protein PHOSPHOENOLPYRUVATE CARBOXYLASE-RELATED KINASE 2) [Durusdinium trenchii]|uniref:Serine/threonine-protein kinase PEPKR2 (Protein PHOSPHOENOLPYRUVATE CARBOXYLASE-RELATED KINASE 2) n=1 Tax=Durusdinium trenchii TaxID=1381693 RepID=A0ABP0J3N4_9DINO
MPSPAPPFGSQAVLDEYTVLKVLGAGKFGEVNEVKHKETKKRFAWKRVKFENDPHCEAEVQVLKQLKHHGVVGIYQVFSQGGALDLILELCSRGDMQQFIESKVEPAPMTGKKMYVPPVLETIADITQQLLATVSFLHENCVAHRDIKPENVLLTSRTQWKLADFNLATTFDPNEYMAEHVGTTPFKAPEVEDMKYTEKCDIYSMGILFIALATGKRYWRPESLEDEEDKLVAEELLSEKTWKDAELGKPALDFAKYMISLEPERGSAEEALKHPFLMQYSSQAGCCTIS